MNSHIFDWFYDNRWYNLYHSYCVVLCCTYRSLGAVETDDTPISGEDVPVFAEGPFAHLFSGVMEQSYVGSTLAFAACTEEFCKEEHCKAAGFKC